MKIYGLQKMTLLDFPGRVACTVFLGLCDFRCPYCHNFELVNGTAVPLMEEEEFFSFLSNRKGLLDGVAVTGGEPTIHADLPEFVRRIRSLGFPVKLDTNGYHPDMLRRLLEEKLIDYAAMDIKNSPEKYASTAGRETLDLSPVRESIALLMGSGTDYEFRTTVVKEFHEQRDFEEIGKMIEGAGKYFLQSFTDRDSVPFGGLSAASKEEMLLYADTARKYVRQVSLRGVD